jgi:single-strand DNA-binding protein
MTDLITVTGVVGSDPRAITTSQQLPITSFRLASARRYFNRATNAWEDAGTNWYTVSAFRNLAFNTNASLRKGEHVIVHGRLKQRPWQAGDKAGIAIEIEADAIGHDLNWGLTQLHRLEQSPRPAADPVPGPVDDVSADLTDDPQAGSPGLASELGADQSEDDDLDDDDLDDDELDDDEDDEDDDHDDHDDLDDLDESAADPVPLQESVRSTA